MYDLRDPWNNRLCCVGAAAAVAATVATVATVGMQAAKAAGAFDPDTPGGAGSGGGFGYIQPGLRELLFNKGTQDILAVERGVLDDALSQGKELEPEMYRALGLEPVYDTTEDPDITGLAVALDQQQSALSSASLITKQSLKSRLKGLKGKARRQQKRENRRLLKQAKLAQTTLQKSITTLTAELEQKQSVGRKVVGFKPIAGVADPTGSGGNAFGAALDSFNLHLSDALAGKEPLDPTLKSSFDERERTLRERLRRSIGPDYETSTAGEQALANFDRERSEAFAQYNFNAIKGYSALAEKRAGALSELTSGRLKNLAFPASFRAALASQLEGEVAARQDVTRTMAAERGVKGGAVASETAANQAAAAERRKALTDLLAGAGSAAGSINDLGKKYNQDLFGTAGGTEYGHEFDTAGALGAGGQLSPSAGTLFGTGR